MFQILFTNINETQEPTLNLSDLPNVELYSDNLKMFNQAREGTLSAFGNDLDEHVRDNLHEQQVKKSTLMKHAWIFYQQDILLKKEPRNYQRLRTLVTDILVQQQQNMLISQKQRSRQQQQQQAQHTFSKAKMVDLGRQNSRARKAENVLPNMTRQRKGKGKGHQSRSPAGRDKSAGGRYTRKTGKSPSGKEDRPSCFNHKR